MASSGPRRSHRAEFTQAVARCRLFFGSYAALFLILAVRFNGLALRGACGALFVLGVGDALLITRRARRRMLSYSVTVRSVEDLGGEVGGYLASYLLPFVTVANPNGRDLVGYGLFLLVALVIYVRSNLVRVNPTFYLFGYRVLRITFGKSGHQFLLARTEPAEGETIAVVDIAGVLLATGQAGA